MRLPKKGVGFYWVSWKTISRYVFIRNVHTKCLWIRLKAEYESVSSYKQPGVCWIQYVPRVQGSRWERERCYNKQTVRRLRLTVPISVTLHWKMEPASYPPKVVPPASVPWTRPKRPYLPTSRSNTITDLIESQHSSPQKNCSEAVNPLMRY